MPYPFSARPVTSFPQQPRHQRQARCCHRDGHSPRGPRRWHRLRPWGLQDGRCHHHHHHHHHRPDRQQPGGVPQPGRGQQRWQARRQDGECCCPQSSGAHHITSSRPPGGVHPTCLLPAACLMPLLAALPTVSTERVPTATPAARARAKLHHALPRPALLALAALPTYHIHQLTSSSSSHTCTGSSEVAQFPKPR